MRAIRRSAFFRSSVDRFIGLPVCSEVSLQGEALPANTDETDDRSGVGH
jgi:hypothetical protein